jgi:hypothetical protein
MLTGLVLLLPNTDCLQQFGDFCQCLFYFYQILTTFNNLEIFVRAWSSVESRRGSEKNLQIVESSQYLAEVEQALIKIFKLLKAVSI